MLPPRHDSSRSEMLALCIALELHPEASYTWLVPARKRRTPDWLMHLSDGRDIALEVTSKRTDWSYEDWDMDGTAIRVGSRHKGWTSGDSADLRRTLARKMKDKAERGQLQAVTVDERWLFIQLDDDAGSELESLFEPVPRIVIDAVTLETVDAYSVATMPDFGDVMESAREFGYDEVWAFTQTVRGDGHTMVLRLRASQQRWECFHMLARSWFEGGGISRKWERAASSLQREAG